MTTATESTARLRVVSDHERCSPNCARLCTDEGMAATMRADRGLLLWRATNSLGDAGLAEQAVQETFLRAWKGCAKFDDRLGSVRSWLLAIARNLVIDIARSRAVRPGDTHWDELDDAIGHRTTVLDFAEALANSWYVEELLDQLPTRSAKRSRRSSCTNVPTRTLLQNWAFRSAP